MQPLSPAVVDKARLGGTLDLSKAYKQLPIRTDYVFRGILRRTNGSILLRQSSALGPQLQYMVSIESAGQFTTYCALSFRLSAHVTMMTSSPYAFQMTDIAIAEAVAANTSRSKSSSLKLIV